MVNNDCGMQQTNKHGTSQSSSFVAILLAAELEMGRIHPWV